MALTYHLSSLEEPFIDRNPNATMQDNLDDELEDTVSLSDLPIYGGDTNYYTTTESDDSMKGDESFRFFSEESFKNVKDLNPKETESIVFCGNLISPKQSMSRNTQEFEKRDHERTKVAQSSGSGRNNEYAKFRAMKKGRNQNHGSELVHETKRVLPSTSKKSRWYYYGVGLAGIPAEMELSAIRSRQNRRQKVQAGGTQGGEEKEESGGFSQEKGLCRLIRDLSCNGQTQANNMVKASLVYIPRVG